ncbi:hypothetical protein GF359_10665 [candidate division WOR-3 bacterium]|uniref:Uncharacterized protein n=1 Tax=candidate division WOR-3 bacterium TaxID=2052148 RepID=A0A9D5KB58_UNCW3|nr:hypothetical protein [candidate division WOR-3 bacterium]MBD3365663.1 hypothetical protein [candidate division WOR-3 bacterium]
MNRSMLDELPEDVLQRLLAGENHSDYSDLVDFDIKVRNIWKALLKENPVPETKTEELDNGWRQDWLDNFSKENRLVAVLIEIWEQEILSPLVRMYQAGNLLVQPFPADEALMRDIRNDSEWYDLTLSAYLNEIYVFKCRVQFWLTKIEKELKRYPEAPESIEELTKRALQDVESLTNQLTQIRGKHMYIYGYSDLELELHDASDIVAPEDSEMDLDSRDLLHSLNKIYKIEWKEITRNHKSAFLKVLDLVSKVFRDSIFFLSPGLKR